ncbi:MAG: surface-adhesin E family protein [Terracidiphilus sp.]
MRVLSAFHRVRRLGAPLVAIVALSAAIAWATDLVFLAEAENPGNGKTYKAYLDRSTIHMEGKYKTAKLVSVYAEPIRAAGFDGVKSMVNTYQLDCTRRVKRVTYIAFLDADGRVIVDEKYADAEDEPLAEGTVDMKIVPYLCGN